MFTYNMNSSITLKKTIIRGCRAHCNYYSAVQPQPLSPGFGSQPRHRPSRFTMFFDTETIDPATIIFFNSIIEIMVHQKGVPSYTSVPISRPLSCLEVDAQLLGSAVDQSVNGPGLTTRCIVRPLEIGGGQLRA